MLFLGIGFVVLVLLAVVGNIIANADNKRQGEEARARLEQYYQDNTDWRKVGVVQSYYNRGMMETMHREKCPICGKENPRSGDSATSRRPCPTCERNYEQEKKDGIVPPGVSPDNPSYNAICYYAFKLIEYELDTGAISENEAREKQQQLANSIRPMHDGV